jgi:membrane protease YdiL (CAAX protease family)
VTEAEPDGAATGPLTPRRHFSTLVTLAFALMAAIYIGLPLAPLLTGAVSPLQQLERPEDSLDRLVTRELDLRSAMHQGGGWEWRLYRLLSGADDPVREAVSWYDELVETVDSPLAAFHRMILLGESGDVDRAEEAIARFKSRDELDERLASWVSAAYLPPAPEPAVGRRMTREIRAQMDPDWFADTLRARIAARIGDGSARDSAQAAIAARGRALQIRLRALMALVLALLVAGVVACARLVRERPTRVADAPLPPVWSAGDGFALLVRGLGAPQAIILVTFSLIPRQASFATLLAMAADLPVFWWVARYLGARGESMASAFGARPRPGAWPRLVYVALALIAVALVGDAAIEALGTLVGIPSHWADGFAEDVLWDPRRAFVINAINVAVWAPIVEELLFRGLLYGTLRTALPVWPAAFVSAALFAIPHGYAAAGSLSVLMSGVLWAIAYERTRSLLPGLLAHSANNLMSTLWAAVLLR